jgi:hypothetical protein
MTTQTTKEFDLLRSKVECELEKKKRERTGIFVRGFKCGVCEENTYFIETEWGYYVLCACGATGMNEKQFKNASSYASEEVFAPVKV